MQPIEERFGPGPIGRRTMVFVVILVLLFNPITGLYVRSIDNEIDSLLARVHKLELAVDRIKARWVGRGPNDVTPFFRLAVKTALVSDLSAEELELKIRKLERGMEGLKLNMEDLENRLEELERRGRL